MTSGCVVTDGMKPTGVCACETPTKPTKNSTLLHNRIFRKMGIPKGLEIHQICRNGLRIYPACRRMCGAKPAVGLRYIVRPAAMQIGLCKALARKKIAYTIAGRWYSA